MSGLEEMLQKQVQTMRSIERAIVNFKKLGQAKMTAATTQNRIAMLKESFQQCQDLDAKISAASDQKTRTTSPYFVEDYFANCEERYQEALDFMAETLSKVSPPLDQAAATGSSSNPMTSQPTVHLPRIHLPSFEGTFEHWESYRDRFTSMIINNKALSNVERLHFLHTSLKGEASLAVSHLPVTENNFEVAWKIITSRYENKRRLISTHLNNLFSLPSVQSETPNELRAFRDKINMSVQMLRNLDRPVDSWSDVIVFFGAQKLDRATRKAWEFNLGDTTEFPTYNEFDLFLEKRIRALEAIPGTNRVKQSETERVKQFPSKSFHTHSTLTTKIICAICKSNHLLYQCPNFAAKTPSERFNVIKQQKRCINCFSIKHTAVQCRSPHCCKECGQKHHTLLHFRAATESDASAPTTSSTDSKHVEISSNLASNPPVKTNVLLSTARVRVHSAQGRCMLVRALLDQGSAATLITESLAQLLRLERTTQISRISGIGETQSIARHVAAIVITPAEKNEPAYSTNAIIMRTLTRYVPLRYNSNTECAHLAGLDLADKDPMSSDQIDIIIGADLYGQLLLQGIRQGSACTPTAQNTTLGWILSGPFHANPAPSTVSIHISVLENLDKNLRRFWEIEELQYSTMLTPNEKKCESHFRASHSRNPDGRYVVRLPFKSGPPVPLGESRFKALKSLQAQENRLRKIPETEKEYRDFLGQYESLGHMRKVSALPHKTNQVYYIPHHAVVRPSSSTTRLRVVFNASSRTTNGYSLNDHLYSGPKLQQDLVAILLRWRQFQYVYSADITKMYRQILVHPQDVDYQRILWRNSSTHPIEEYQLRTVTYGTTPAPYLALRVLRQLAEDEGPSYPEAVQVLSQQAYVDDFLFGSDSIASLLKIRNQTIQLLQRGGFSLRKWASNDSALLSDIDPANHGLTVSKSLRLDEKISVLGILWNPAKDQFQFQAALPETHRSTKREILSSIAKIFDPMGWVAPFIVTAKILIQRLWLVKCDWDEVVPQEYLKYWHSFRAQFPELQTISLPRKVSNKIFLSQSLHGFSDASSSAYAAVVYARSVLQDGSVSTTLIMAKTRVAPVKTISIPRLELCAALLLSRLITFIQTALNRPTDCYCWTDSSITLTWLSKPPSRWKTFVANRVAKIQNLIPAENWRHVPTDENPADCASRGISLKDLKSHPLWWKGPKWLPKNCSEWPLSNSKILSDPSIEERAPKIPIFSISNHSWDLVNRYSSWPKLLRVTAYVLRFVNNVRTQQKNRASPTKPCPKNKATPLILNPIEIQNSKLFWLKHLQSEVFSSELKSLKETRGVSKSSPLRSLNPFVASDGLIHANGRLTNANIPAQTKTPIILKTHPLLTMIIESTHRNLLHAGLQLTLAYLRNQYWILRARTTIRMVLYRCVACAREKAVVPQELMGDLPAPRVDKVERAFINTGVDYAGPVQVRTSPGRGRKTTKAYIAIFVCLTTKALHIELVSDYTSATFIAAFHRFVSRRGRPVSMYSDNGTTFHGANRELALAHKAAIKNPDFNNLLASDGIAWHFLPPNAPHFGGLWEAAVKSIKYHMRRTIGSHTLTFEELTTMLCRIEACLNSRPLGALSDCIEDYSVLTPGHFLIGTPITAQPEPSVLDLKENRLSRWQLVQKLTESFWKSWQTDYLHTLHQRPKWRTIQQLTRVGQIVLVRKANLPPSQWELGRIISCHPGNDGLVRVVTIKTANSEYKRPLSKLCFLPVSLNAENDHAAT